jgi:hypothetical protein
MADKADKGRDRFAVKKQTKVPSELVKKFRMMALDQGKDVREIYDEAIYDFFSDRREHLKKSSALDLYNAPPSTAKVVNVQMDEKAAKEIEAIAEKDASSGSRIIYTSIVKYAQKKGLL